MSLSTTICFAFLLICTSLGAPKEPIEGGLTMSEWSKKCNDYFKKYPRLSEKEFLISGYCESFVCENFEYGQIGMRKDSCPGKTVNGKRCIPNHVQSLPYPKCCRLKCSDD